VYWIRENAIVIIWVISVVVLAILGYNHMIP
jgi:hypothetical protein